MIEALRAKPGCRTIALSVHPDNAVARRLYGSVGFRETGEIEDGELVMRLAVRAARRRA
jgi:diamine N-acetyltransferase